MSRNKYTVNWEKHKDTDWDHTASTLYVTDGYKIWKGKRRIFSIIYSADKWHLVRTKDNYEVHSGKTAKECMGCVEYAIKHGRDVADVHLWEGVKFNDDFTGTIL